MSEWIECNLPWYYKTILTDLPFNIEYQKVVDEAQNRDKNNWSSDPILGEAYKVFSKFYNEIREEDKKKSFTGLGLNKPGTVIQYNDHNKELQTIIIGHINEAAGRCDCCCEPIDIVIRYKFLDI